MTAVGTSQINDQLQFTGRVIHVLSFESSLFGFVRPGESFVDVDQAVDSAKDGYDPPTCGLGHLQHWNKYI